MHADIKAPIVYEEGFETVNSQKYCRLSSGKDIRREFIVALLELKSN